MKTTQLEEMQSLTKLSLLDQLRIGIGKGGKPKLLGQLARLLTQIDCKRSLAMSAVLITHTLVFGIMLLPAAPIAAIALPPPEPPWVEVSQKPLPPPPPKPTPPPVRPAPIVQPITATPPAAPPIETPILLATTQSPSEDIGDPIGNPIAPTIVDPPAAVGGNVSESILKVLRSPPPRFPPELVRAGFSGTVEFSVLVGIDGTAEDIKLMKSSGNRKLDRSTLSHIKRYWRFKAPEQNGQVVPGWGRGRVTFTMAG